MSGFVLGHGRCFCCGTSFTFNPNKVPSIRHRGQREPICRPCVDRVNPERAALGLEPIVPEPDAYEPLPANDLGAQEGRTA